MFISQLAVDNVPQPIEDVLAENFSRNRQKRDSPPVVAVSQISLLWNADYFTIFPILWDITSITDLVTETIHPRDNIATSPPTPLLSISAVLPSTPGDSLLFRVLMAYLTSSSVMSLVSMGNW